jgi:hypothetical protein
MLIRRALLLLLCCSLIQGAENSSAPDQKQRLRKYIKIGGIALGGTIVLIVLWKIGNKAPSQPTHTPHPYWPHGECIRPRYLQKKWSKPANPENS